MPAACDDQNIDDIEDIFTSKNSVFNERLQSRDYVIPKIRKFRKPKDEGDNVIYADSIIPGTQTIYVKTWGCSHNSSDGEYMAGQLAAYGYKITEEKEKAHLWLLNSCTVKNPAEDHFHNAIKEAYKLSKYVVVAGCVPQAAPRQEHLKKLSIVGVQQIDRVVEVVEETLKGHVVRLLGQKKVDGRKVGGASLQLPKIRKNPLIEIISINTGCLNQCTYCKTKHARGELGSYPVEDIVKRSEQSFKEGICEIWLTSEDTGAYGHDIGITLPQLLWQLIETIPEGAMLRLGMTNPPYILEHIEEMAKILNHPRVYSFLHIPVQSGSDSVLMDMKREYCIKDFKEIVDFLKQRVPDITIATDIICGFPTETEENFEQTMQLVEQYRFPSLFINQFFPRPGTPAARLPRISAQQVKQRTKRLSELFQSYKPYEHKLGEKQKILITEISHDKKHLVGHNKYYEQILVPKDEELMGKMVNVKIIATQKHCLIGKVCSDSEIFTPSIAPPLAQGQVSGLVEHQSKSPNTWWLVSSAVFLLLALVLRLICKFCNLQSMFDFFF